MFNQLVSFSRREAAILAGLAAGVAVYPLLPAVTWSLAFLYLAGYLTERVRELDRSDRRWLLIGTAVAGIVQLTYFFLNSSYDPTTPDTPTTWLDDETYYSNAGVIAGVWRDGFFPELSRKGSLPYLGTLHTGYERLLASAFYLTGQSVAAGLALNLISTMLLPALVFFLAKSLFQELPTPGLSSPRAAMLVLLFHPGLYYWGGQLLKDHILATMFMAALLLLVDTFQTRRPSRAAGFLLLLFWTAILRNYAALSLVAAAMVYPFKSLRLKDLLRAALIGGLALVYLSYTETGGRYLGQLLSSLFSIVPSELQSARAALVHFGAAVPRMILGPYAWLRIDDARALYELYPAMWYLYLVVYPLALAGLFHTIRANSSLTLVPVTALLANAFVLMLAYGGNASRQRFYLELVAVVYAGLGARVPAKRVTVPLVWAGILLFAALQLWRLWVASG